MGHIAEGKAVRILLDAHQSPFSERYKALLSKVGVEVEDFYVPPLHYHRFLDYCKQIAKSKATLIHFLWAFNQPPVMLMPRLFGKKVLMHWIGSDVTMALKRPRTPWKMLGSYHLAMDVSLSHELLNLGIKAPVVRGVVPFPDTVPPWPTDYKVLTYLPPNRGLLYGPKETLQLARDLPWATFLVAGNDGQDMVQLPNVHYLGWVNNMEEVYAQCKVVVRLTKHDSGGGSVMEGVARERYAVWTKRYAGCQFVDSYETAKSELERCLKRNESNKIGREVVLADFNQEKITRQLLEVYQNV